MLDDFFQVVLGLKKIQRKGWKDKLKIENPESVADHSYSMTIMAMTLADMLKLDTKKIMKMSLLHDLSESQIGDYTPDEISRQRKIEIENNAMKKILAMLPTDLANEYKTIWDEYQTGKTTEAIFLHEIDKLEMIFQAKLYINDGHSKEKIQSFIDTANNEIKNTQLREILTKILQ